MSSVFLDAPFTVNSPNTTVNDEEIHSTYVYNTVEVDGTTVTPKSETYEFKTAKKVQQENKIKIDFLVGTMIELPRAAIKAKDIAKHAEFFSFGTNDLTQTTFGISRDDSGKFLNDYIENKIFTIDPFISIDDGVKDLVKIAVEKGKKQNKRIKLGICGEHGGDPDSILFCSRVGLNYISCSPYRVPIARLAAAQAELQKK